MKKSELIPLVIILLLILAIFLSNQGKASAYDTTTGARRPEPQFHPVVITPRPVVTPEILPLIVVRPEVQNKPKIVVTTSPSIIAGNAVAAKKYALDRIGATQFACLNDLWNKESHWNYKAHNKYSGAYGIPQAVPGSKMAWAGADWKTNPITQVKWGLHYIKSRYGSACRAWSFWLSHHWY